MGMWDHLDFLLLLGVQPVGLVEGIEACEERAPFRDLYRLLAEVSDELAKSPAPSSLLQRHETDVLLSHHLDSLQTVLVDDEVHVARQHLVILGRPEPRPSHERLPKEPFLV